MSISFYYEMVFFILIILQDNFKGFMGSFLCFLMLVTGDPFFTLMLSEGFFFYEVAILFDIMFFIAGIYLINTLIGKCLIISTFFSICVNLVGWYCFDQDLYYQYAELYQTLNIIFIEILVYACFSNTIVYPYMKKKFLQWSEMFYAKFN